jgi:hypothetical protein
VKNVLWGAGALLILVLSFTLPLGDFRLSLNHVGRVSKPLTSNSFVGASKEINCSSLKFELQSRELSLNNFWLGFGMFCLVAGIASIAFTQPNNDRVTSSIALTIMVVSFVWLAHSFGQQQRQLGAGQVLYSSHCTGLVNP